VIITPKETSSSFAAAALLLLLIPHLLLPLPVYMYIHCFSELRRIILD
jgi:hypothetical protein